MSDTIFFRLLDGENRPSRLSGAVEELRESGKTSDIHRANPDSFRQVPGSPFAYWVSEEVRGKFAELPPLENEKREARFGASTKNDFRFLRLWWETPDQLSARSREATLIERRWVPFAKGGTYSPFYTDLELVIDWANDGEILKKEISEYRGKKGWGYNWTAAINGHSYYFRPGLTWPRRTDGLSFRVLPTGCIFGDKGPVVFAKDDDRWSLYGLSGVVNSSAFYLFVRMLVARVSLAQSFEVGLIQSIPTPELSGVEAERLGELALRCIDLKRRLDATHETSHIFALPALLQAEDGTLVERAAGWQDRVSWAEQELEAYQREIDDISFRLYGIEGADRRAIEESLNSGDDDAVPWEGEGTAEAEDYEPTAIVDSGPLASDLLSYAVGCVFGRWDARIALDPSLAPRLADPFAPLPVCSPSMLVGPDSLPAQRDGITSEEWMRARPDAITPPPDGSVENTTIPDSEYPLAVDWDGILVDDPDHPDDIVCRVRDVLELVWGGRADEIEHEACGLLGIKDLRAYFRNPRKFWDFHVKRYSKSRRKAPIYWLLQSPKKSFGLWIYYHRLDPDILFKALTKYVEPKIRLEESRLEEYEAQRRDAGTGGSEAKKAEKAVQDQETLLTDLREFRDRLQRAAGLYLRPDLNDGVALNIAPLHELVSWKEAKSKWDDLLSGKYEWSSIGKQLREKGLV